MIVMTVLLSHRQRLVDFALKFYLFMAQGPAYLYTYGRWRFSRLLRRQLARPGQLSAQEFFTRCRPAAFGLSGSTGRQNEAALAAAFQAYFRSRRAPRFTFENDDIPRLIELVPPQEVEKCISAADEVCAHVFRFRQAGPVKFEHKIDWFFRPRDNIDWRWDLNRHAYFETLGRAYWYTGDDRYALKFRDLLLDWLAANPVGVAQPNWSSVFEVAFRINTWIWAFYLFRSTPVFDSETCLALLKGLMAHGLYLDANLELHVLNNHLLLEAKALAMLGLLFPEFKPAKKWLERGLNVLYAQVEAQVCADGTHGERSSHYHRVIAGEMLELLVLLDNNNIPVPAAVRGAVTRMVEFEAWITKPNGQVPLLGDSALEDTHLRFSTLGAGAAYLGRADLKAVAPPLNEADIWLLGNRRVAGYQALPYRPPALASRAFVEGGYFVMRAGQGPGAAYMVFDCGPFGYPPTPNHGHADALSLELHALGQTLVVDPGVYSTHLGLNWRNFFRGSRAHNTVVVDDLDQSTLLDFRRVYRPAQATLHRWSSNQHFDYVDGSHDGYQRLAEPVGHRRQIFFVKPEYWVIVDRLTGQGEHSFDLYFHLMPGVKTWLDPATGSACVESQVEAGLLVAPLAAAGLQADISTGSTDPIQGWVSFLSGQKLPAPALRYRQVGPAPVEFVTVLYPFHLDRGAMAAVSTLPLAAQSMPAAPGNPLALAIETETFLDFLVIDQGLISRRKEFAGYETDAFLVYIRRQKEDNLPLKVVMRGGSRLSYEGRSILGDKVVKGFELDWPGMS